VKGTKKACKKIKNLRTLKMSFTRSSGQTRSAGLLVANPDGFVKNENSNEFIDVIWKFDDVDATQVYALDPQLPIDIIYI
jgi:hypothetical protein